MNVFNLHELGQTVQLLILLVFELCGSKYISGYFDCVESQARHTSKEVVRRKTSISLKRYIIFSSFIE